MVVVEAAVPDSTLADACEASLHHLWTPARLSGTTQEENYKSKSMYGSCLIQ